MMVYVECFNDTYLFKQIKKIKGNLEIDHAGNKTRVIKKIKKNKSGLGIVDKDNDDMEKELPGSVFIRKKYGISVYSYHKSIIIEFEIDLENWLYTVARNNKLKPSDYNLPNSLNNDLPGHVKKMYKKKGYSKFIYALLKSEEFQFLLSQIP